MATAQARRVCWVACLGWGLLAVFALGGGLLGDIYGETVAFGGEEEAVGDQSCASEVARVRVWQALYTVGCLGFVLLLISFRRRPAAARTIIIAAILLRLPLLFCPPNDDCNRYAWEGRIQNLGFNPYSTGPLDPRLEPHRDDLWQSINKKHYTTIYPPLAELEFRLLATVHYAVKTPQVAHTVIDIGVILALGALLSLLGQPAWHLAIYALCPLVLASFAHAGHNDSLMILALIAFLAAAKKERWHLAGVALGLAILAKTVPAILLALLVRRSWRAVGIALLTVIAGYLVYLEAGWQLFSTLHHFPSSDHFNNLFDELRIWLNRLLDLRVLARDRNLICLALLVGAAAYRIVRPRDLIVDARWLMGLVILMLPIIHFWYVTWVLALVALLPRGYWAWLVLTVTMAMYWQAQESSQMDGGWGLEWWVVAAIWLPFFVAWIVETARNRQVLKDRRDKG